MAWHGVAGAAGACRSSAPQSTAQRERHWKGWGSEEQDGPPFAAVCLHFLSLKRHLSSNEWCEMRPRQSVESDLNTCSLSVFCSLRAGEAWMHGPRAPSTRSSVKQVWKMPANCSNPIAQWPLSEHYTASYNLSSVYCLSLIPLLFTEWSWMALSKYFPVGRTETVMFFPSPCCFWKWLFCL